MAEWLKNVGHDALAAGWSGNSAKTLELLCWWADKIVVMEPYIVEKIPAHYKEKVLVCDVGMDFYGTPKHPDLVTLVKNWAARVGLRPSCGVVGTGSVCCNLDLGHSGKHANHTDSGTVAKW
jgi:hypothetical protein